MQLSEFKELHPGDDAAKIAANEFSFMVQLPAVFDYEYEDETETACRTCGDSKGFLRLGCFFFFKREEDAAIFRLSTAQ